MPPQIALSIQRESEPQQITPFDVKVAAIAIDWGSHLIGIPTALVTQNPLPLLIDLAGSTANMAVTAEVAWSTAEKHNRGAELTPFETILAFGAVAVHPFNPLNE